jgi:hypothetical protein
MNDSTQRKIPTAAEKLAQQKRDHAPGGLMTKATVPATVPKAPLPAVPDKRTPVQSYLDEIAPASIVGRMVKFGKDGTFVTSDDGETIADTIDFVVLADQTLIGFIKFNGEGTPPDRHMGLLYDGWRMPERSTLGDTDVTQWENGLDGKPADPWQHHVYLVLQCVETSELFTFVTSSITGRRAVGNLLRHYDRMVRTNPDEFPVVRLKIGGFQHRDDRVGWVATPVFAVVGRRVKDAGLAKPDTSPSGDLDDGIPSFA